MVLWLTCFLLHCCSSKADIQWITIFQRQGACRNVPWALRSNVWRFNSLCGCNREGGGQSSLRPNATASKQPRLEVKLLDRNSEPTWTLIFSYLWKDAETCQLGRMLRWEHRNKLVIVQVHLKEIAVQTCPFKAEFCTYIVRATPATVLMWLGDSLRTWATGYEWTQPCCSWSWAYSSVYK